MPIVKNIEVTDAQEASFYRLVNRLGEPQDVHLGIGGDYLGAVFDGLYVGIERDGYAHT